MTTVKDPILTAWERTRANNRDRAAIFDSQGKVARTFLEIEDRARQFADELERIAPGQVLAIQIGNHPDWPSLFLACLRKRIVVLPLEQTISDEQRQNAFRLCQVAGFATLSSRAENASPARTEESRCVIFKVTSAGSLGFARDDGNDRFLNWSS